MTKQELSHTVRNWALVATVSAGVIAGLVTLLILVADGGGSTTGDHTQLGSIATRVGTHAGEVRAHGEQMIQAGNAESQALWVEQGTALLGEARRLEGVAAQIVAIERDRGILYSGSGVDIYRLRADGNALRDAGQSLVDHGKEFAATADQMIAQAQGLGSPGLTDSAQLMLTSAGNIGSDGRIVISAGQSLVDEAEQLERSLGH